MSEFVVRCPACRGKFPWDPTIGFPACCPLLGCGWEREDKSEVVISAPFIRSAKMKATDDCYRQLEKSSEARAQMAAEQLGVPVSEMSHLKVTNIKDNVKEGEIAAMPVVNEVTKQMDAAKQRGGQFGFVRTDVNTYSDAAVNGGLTINGQHIKGVVPRAGIRAMEQIKGQFR